MMAGQRLLAVLAAAAGPAAFLAYLAAGPPAALAVAVAAALWLAWRFDNWTGSCLMLAVLLLLALAALALLLGLMALHR